MKGLERILEAREKRVELQRQLQEEYKLPMLVLRANMPGIDKDNEMSNNIVEFINELILEILNEKIIYTTFINEGEGPIIIHVVDLDSKELKGMAISIEETHQLGRCVDIDVYDENSCGISRRDLGYSARRCFLCDEEAHICVRSRKHNIEDVIKFIENKYEQYCKYRS